jgi:sialate O-acetylesterase
MVIPFPVLCEGATEVISSPKENIASVASIKERINPRISNANSTPKIKMLPAITIVKSTAAKIRLITACAANSLAGDSITEITSYTAHLQSMLGPNYTVGNFGVSGSTVTLNSSKPYMKQPQYTAAQNFDPDIVVIMLGTNDAHSYLQKYSGNFVRDYTMLANSFENLSSTKQVIVVK